MKHKIFKLLCKLNKRLVELEWRHLDCRERLEYQVNAGRMIKLFNLYME